MTEVDDFRDALFTDRLENVVTRFLFEGDTYVFRSWPDGLTTMRAHLSSMLRVGGNNICVVGSAKTGFSLSPDSFGRSFAEGSDVDVVVVSEEAFDQIWRILLDWNYPRRYRLAGGDRRWAKERQDDLYWGWFRPDKLRFQGLSLPAALRPLRDISELWFRSFRSLSRDIRFARREYSGRLYRTWEHAMLYHADGLRKLRGQLRSHLGE